MLAGKVAQRPSKKTSGMHPNASSNKNPGSMTSSRAEAGVTKDLVGENQEKTALQPLLIGKARDYMHDP